MLLALSILVIDIAVCAIAVVAAGPDPHLHFREFGLVTWLNGAQLLACAGLAGGIYSQRRREPTAPAVVWLWMLFATAFLAFDELFSISRTDGAVLTAVRGAFGLAPAVAFKGKELIRFGDLVQLSFAAVLVMVAWSYRQELLRVRSAIGFYVLGVALLAGSLYIDAGPSHGRWVALGVDSLGGMLQPMQDTFKVTGFGAILAGFVVTYRKA